MTIALNGTNAYLEFAGKLVSSFPCTITAWVSKDGSTGNAQFWATQAQSNGDRFMGAWLDANGTSVYANLRTPGNSSNATRSVAPVPDATMRLVVAVYASTTSRTIYFSDNTGYPASTVMVDDITNHDRFTLGAWHYNNTAASTFMSGSIAEAHVYSKALSSTEVQSLISDSVKPESITGWVDGWDLKDYQASGNYVSLGGTRTLVAVGGVSASGKAHPISRTTPDTTVPVMTGSITPSAITTTSFTISWSAATDNVGVAGYEYSIDNGTTYNNINNVLTKNVTGLTQSTAYQVKVRAYDAAGNKAVPLSTSITTATPDTTVPVMTGTLASSSVTSGGFTLTWSAASDNVAVTGYEYSTDSGSTYTDAGNVLTKAISGLTASTLYHTAVRAYDAAGNKAIPLTLDVTTAANSDVTAPTMSGSITPSAITLTSFTISWPAASDNVAVTGYEYSINGGSSYNNVNNVLTTTIGGLAQSTAYAVRVRAYDAAGNRATPLQATVTTASPATVTLTVGPFENNTGQVLANLTGLTVMTFDLSTFNSVAKVFTNQSTDASGYISLTDNAGLLTAGSNYAVLTKNASNVLGVEKYQAV